MANATVKGASKLELNKFSLSAGGSGKALGSSNTKNKFCLGNGSKGYK